MVDHPTQVLFAWFEANAWAVDIHLTSVCARKLNVVLCEPRDERYSLEDTITRLRHRCEMRERFLRPSAPKT